MKSLLIVGLGGALGSMLRFLLSKYLTQTVEATSLASLPVGTLTVNLLGCFVFGLVSALAVRTSVISSELQLLLVTGFCGAFTTFSTFINDSNSLSRTSLPLLCLYLLLSLSLGFAMLLAGNWIGNRWGA